MDKALRREAEELRKEEQSLRQEAELNLKYLRFKRDIYKALSMRNAEMSQELLEVNPSLVDRLFKECNSEDDFADLIQVNNNIPERRPGWCEKEDLTILATDPIPQDFLQVLAKHAKTVHVIKPSTHHAATAVRQHVCEDLKYGAQELQKQYRDASVIHFKSVLLTHPKFAEIVTLTADFFKAPAEKALTLTDETTRRMNEVHQLLKSQTIVGVSGPTGTSKSTSIIKSLKDTPKIRAFFGKGQRDAFIKACLQETENNTEIKCVLFEDEANVKEGSSASDMEFYENLMVNPPFVMQDGSKCEFPQKNIRVIFAGNPSQYGNRIGTGIFEHIPYVEFGRFSDTILLGFIKDELAVFGFQGDKASATETVLALYKTTRQSLHESGSPQFVSLRNLKNACARIAILEGQNQTENEKIAENLIPKLGAYREFKKLFQGISREETKVK